jgi:hypothetical protein
VIGCDDADERGRVDELRGPQPGFVFTINIVPDDLYAVTVVLAILR